MAIKTGKVGHIKINTDSVAFTTEATTEAGSTKIYQIDDVTKRTWDPNTAITINVGALDESYYDDGINWFEGKVKLLTTGEGTLTVTGKSMTMLQVGEVHNWALTMTLDVGENTELGDTWKTNMPLGKSASLTISRYRIDTLLDQGEGGYQEVGLSGKTDTTDTGLTAEAQYYFKIDIDGAGVVEYDITLGAGTANELYAPVLALMNTALVAAGAYMHLVNGDLRCTSETNGATSSIALSAGTTGTDLFATLTGWSAFDEAVVGSTEPEYYIFKLYEDADSGFFCKVLQTSLGLTKAVNAIDAESISFEISANVSYFTD